MNLRGESVVNVIYTISHLIFPTTLWGRQSWDSNPVDFKAHIVYPTLHCLRMDTQSPPWPHSHPSKHSHLSLLRLPSRNVKDSKFPLGDELCLIERQNGLFALYLFGWDLSPQDQEVNNVTTRVGKREYKFMCRASLVAQWLRVCLPMQGTRVRALVWEDPTCLRATKPVSHNYWACASGACAPQRERPRQWEARAPRWRVAPACRN